MAVQTHHFTTFEKTFGGDLVTPTHPQYESAIARWAVNAQRRASIVAFVKDEADVVLAIKYARDNALPIAIRGGGHNSAGTSSSENGLVIDLSRYITAVRVDEDKKVAHVGGGALWRDVDREAIKFGMATVGGTVNNVSVWSRIIFVNLTQSLSLDWSRGVRSYNAQSISHSYKVLQIDSWRGFWLAHSRTRINDRQSCSGVFHAVYCTLDRSRV